MRTLTTELLRKRPRRNADLADARQPGLVLRCWATGTHSWLVPTARGRWSTLGAVTALTLTQARDEARKVLAQSALGEEPRQAHKAMDTPTLRTYITDTYGPWARAHHSCSHRRRRLKLPRSRPVSANPP